MSIPSSTIRTAVELRIVELLVAEDGFTADPDEARSTDDEDPTVGPFWPAAFGSTVAPTATRWVVIGTPDGAINPDGIQASSDPSSDVWTVACAIGCTDIYDGPTAKQVVEDVLNRIGSMFARTPRLNMNPGPTSVYVGDWVGPKFVNDPGQAPLAWINFDVDCSALIERQP